PSRLDRELHNQNGVFRQQANKHDQSHLNINIVFQAGQVDKQIHSEQTNRYRQYNRQRQDVAFILGGKQIEYEDDTECKDQQGLIARFTFFQTYARPFVVVISRKEFSGNLVHNFHRVSRAVPFAGGGIDGNGIHQIVPGHYFRAHYFAQSDQGIGRNHFVPVVSNED